MNDHDHATCTAMEESDRASVRIFAMMYRNSKDEVRAAMRRDPVWKEHTPKEPDLGEWLGESAVKALENHASEQAELSALRRWKGEQMLVEAQWNPQAVGTAMGIPLGHNILPAIQPWIEEAKARVTGLRMDRAQLLSALSKIASFDIGDSIEPEIDMARMGDIARAAIAKATAK